jgi:hypothetical protein
MYEIANEKQDSTKNRPKKSPKPKRPLDRETAYKEIEILRRVYEYFKVFKTLLLKNSKTST